MKLKKAISRIHNTSSVNTEFSIGPVWSFDRYIHISRPEFLATKTNIDNSFLSQFICWSALYLSYLEHDASIGILNFHYKT